MSQPKTENKWSVRRIAWVGLMAALVFVFSNFSIHIPTAIGNTRIHFGNIFCLLSGLMLGPVGGGLAAGIGSALFDLTNPLYISSTPFTFVFKFLMAYVCAKLAWGGQRRAESFRFNFIGSISGALLYVVLYLAKTFVENIFFLRMEMTPTLITVGQKGLVSAANAVIAVAVVLPLFTALKKGLVRANINTAK